MNPHNTSGAPDAVRPAPLGGVVRTAGTLEIRVPAKSVAVVQLR
jgi:hypothetical protein